jgi:hypothetical protein
MKEEQYLFRDRRSTVDLLLVVRQQILKVLHREINQMEGIKNIYNNCGHRWQNNPKFCKFLEAR